MEEGSGQKVADEALEIRGENVYITTVGARDVSVHERAAHFVATREEDVGGLVPVRSPPVNRCGTYSAGICRSSREDANPSLS